MFGGRGSLRGLNLVSVSCSFAPFCCGIMYSAVSLWWDDGRASVTGFIDKCTFYRNREIHSPVFLATRQTLETSSEMVAFSLDQMSPVWLVPGRAEPDETLPVMFSLAQAWCLGVAQEASRFWDLHLRREVSLIVVVKYLIDLIFYFVLLILCLNF